MVTVKFALLTVVVTIICVNLFVCLFVSLFVCLFVCCLFVRSFVCCYCCCLAVLAGIINSNRCCFVAIVQKICKSFLSVSCVLEPDLNRPVQVNNLSKQCKLSKLKTYICVGNLAVSPV